MNLLPWLQRKWRAMVPGRVYILSHMGTPVTTWVASRLPASYRLTSRPPNYEGGWSVRWWWLDLFPPGLTLDHPESAYTVVRVAEGVPPGQYRLECVYTRTSDGAEFRSEPFSVVVIDPTQHE